MVDYTIAAIPTVYRGRRYRSRLEARWAAYFDLLGWSVEYEPIDLGPWSPDFAVWGKYAHAPTYIEVKPIHFWDVGVGRKIADAVDTACPGSMFILVGTKPTFDLSSDVIGWVGCGHDYEAAWSEATIGLDSLGRFDMNPISSEFDMSTILWGLPEIARPHPTKDLWNEAANLVQWKGPQKSKSGRKPRSVAQSSGSSHSTHQPI